MSHHSSEPPSYAIKDSHSQNRSPGCLENCVNSDVSPDYGLGFSHEMGCFTVGLLLGPEL